MDVYYKIHLRNVFYSLKNLYKYKYEIINININMKFKNLYKYKYIYEIYIWNVWNNMSISDVKLVNLRIC